MLLQDLCLMDQLIPVILHFLICLLMAFFCSLVSALYKRTWKLLCWQAEGHIVSMISYISIHLQIQIYIFSAFTRGSVLAVRRGSLVWSSPLKCSVAPMNPYRMKHFYYCSEIVGEQHCTHFDHSYSICGEGSAHLYEKNQSIYKKAVWWMNSVFIVLCILLVIQYMFLNSNTSSVLVIRRKVHFPEVHLSDPP